MSRRLSYRYLIIQKGHRFGALRGPGTILAPLYPQNDGELGDKEIVDTPSRSTQDRHRWYGIGRLLVLGLRL